MCIATSALAGPVRERDVRSQDHTAEPTSVAIIGSFQTEVGCTGDWDASCGATALTFNPFTGVWRGSIAVPAGTWEYKAALNGTFDEVYGDGDANVTLTASGPSIRFYYSHATHWITSNANATIATAAGSFQSELGCPGDWQPDCLRSWLQDPEGDGTYSFTTTALPAGAYEVKVAIDESWSENYGVGGAPGGANIPFTVPFDGAEMLFSYDSASHVLSISVRSGAHDDNISWSDLHHDSRLAAYRTPRGAVESGTAVTLRLRALAGDLTGAQVRIWDDRANAESFVAMEIAASDDGYDWWEATIPAQTIPTILEYRFIAEDGTATAFYEDDAAKDGGAGETVAPTGDRSWKITHYDAAFTTPQWIKDGIVYQIVPDRFRDGDASNNTPDGSFFYNKAGGTITRSSTTDWNEEICDPRDASGPCPGAFSNNFYGGDLNGVVQQLPYLQSLGVNVLYLNPIFESPSSDKYDTADFSRIDDNLGGETAFDALMSAADAAGMRVVLDGAFNRTSSDSVYFDRYGRFDAVGACESETSTYRAFYFFSGPGPCAGGMSFATWFGYDHFPMLNTANAGVRQLIWDDLASVARSLVAEGVDGWRLDVGSSIDGGATSDPSNDHWEGFRSAVRAENPETWIVGEEWGFASGLTLGSEWDAATNYQLSSAILSFWRDETFLDNDHNSGSSVGALTPISPSELDARLRNIEERYPREAFLAMMNILGSHDTGRALFMLDHRADENDPAIYDDPNYDWSDAITRLKGASLLQMTLPGAPTIYYGDEIGLVGPPAHDGGSWQDDPYNRQPYPWADQSGTPYYPHLRIGGAGESLRAHYQLLTSARNSHEALRTGSFDTLRVDDANEIYAYGRKLADASDAAVVIVNRSSVVQTIAVTVAGYVAEGAEFQDVLNGGASYFVTGGTLTVPDIGAHGGALLVLASTHATPPATVADLTATAGSNEVVLTWSAAPGATSYDVYKSVLRGGGYTFVATASDENFTVGGLSNRVDYYFVVISRDDVTGLTSAPSNEATATPALDLGDPVTSWFNLQWPPMLAHTVSTTTPTDPIYARIWIDGVTSATGRADGIRAEVGYGPVGSLPGEAWTWSAMTFDSQAGSSQEFDEYTGTLLPDGTGSYDYAVRFSSDGGVQWWYADLDGPQRSGVLANPGDLTVNASSDMTAPAAPQNLVVSATSANAITLVWTANDEEDLAGYEVHRELVGTPGFSRIARTDAASTGFTDASVTSGTAYRYLVKSYDTSFNRSAASNVVEASAELRYVEITLHVTAPAFTPAGGTLYVTGGLPELSSWGSGVAMTNAGASQWTHTLHVLDGTAFQYKFTRGSWETVETAADGIGDVTHAWTASYGTTGAQTVAHAVANWRDPLVVSHSPAAGATGVPATTTVTVSWSKPMNGGTDFVIENEDGAVSGSFANASGTTTFTPAAPLMPGTMYSVTVSGETSASGDLQQTSVAWTFTTACDMATPVVSAEGPVTFCEGGSVTLTSSSASGNQWYRNGQLLPGETMDSLTTTTAGKYTVVVSSGSCSSAPSAASTVNVLPKPDATITAPASMNSGASASASVNVLCGGMTFSWSISGGTLTGGQGTPNVTFIAGPSGTLMLTVTVTGQAGCSDTRTANISVALAPFGAPSDVGATAAGTAANVRWAAVASAIHYEIYRSTDNQTWVYRGATTLTAFNDPDLAPATAYLYRVRALRSGGVASAYSGIDVATTAAFSDLTACLTTVRAAHVLELRNAINLLRQSVGLGTATFTDPSLARGMGIKAIHITELRNALAPALGAIDVMPSYTDGTLTARVTTIKRAHVMEIQNRLR